MQSKVIIDWPLTPMTGWGSYGIQLAQGLYESGYSPLLARISERSVHCDLHWLALLDHLEKESVLIRNMLEVDNSKPIELDAQLLFHPIGNLAIQPRCNAFKKVGIIFFESSQFRKSTFEIMQKLDLVIAGSRWNYELLNKAGLQQVELVYQGVDTARFNPAPVRRLIKRSLVIFAGGKLEARKGQDIVIEAFRKLIRHYPDALLIVAWSNLGDVGLDSLLDCEFVDGRPQNGRTQGIRRWLAENGIPEENLLVLPPLVNSQFPNLIKQSDVAVFASRCEGGTNLMAMETLACGIPTLLSANTGHLDLLDMGMEHALAIGRNGQGNVQHNVTIPYGGDPAGLWGETNPEELVDWWIRIAKERTKWRLLGQKSAKAMEQMSWLNSMHKLISILNNRDLLLPCQ